MDDTEQAWWEEPVPAELARTWAPPSDAYPDGGWPPAGEAGHEGADAEPEAEAEREPPRTDPEAMELRDRIVEALKNVIDPELGMNIVDLGLVYDVDVYLDRVHIRYTLTTMGCPIGPLIEAEMQRLLADIPGIDQVEAEMVFRPPWAPEMMSEEAKAAFGFF